MMLTFLDVALGLTLLFATLSMFCSSLLEAWSGWTGKRGAFLLQALLEIVGDLSLYRRLVHHHAIASSFDGRPGAGKPPSYLSSDRFVAALLDVIPERASAIGMPGDYAPVGQPADLEPQSQELLRAASWLDNQGYAIGKPLAGLVRRNGQSIESLRRALASWYDSQMERVAGRYKRSSQVMLFVFGCAMATVFNIDTLTVTRALVQQPALRAWAVDNAQQFVPPSSGASEPSMQAAKQLYEDARSRRLPIGFGCLNEPKLSIEGVWTACRTVIAGQGQYDWVLKITGLLITGLAVSFGAPFWFDLLGKLANLRNSGTPEREKKR
jgi:hypothetical protein